MSCVHNRDLMLVFQYGLLSEERSETIEKNLSECSACRETLQHAKQIQAQLEEWLDVEPPSTLLKDTLNRIFPEDDSTKPLKPKEISHR